MTGPCAKTQVTATLIARGGSPRFTGTNDCRNPQRVCPRIEAGHGRDRYEHCVLTCKQYGHAEVVVLQKAREWAVGSTVYIDHHRVCDSCRAALENAGVAHIILGKAP